MTAQVLKYMPNTELFESIEKFINCNDAFAIKSYEYQETSGYCAFEQGNYRR